MMVKEGKGEGGQQNDEFQLKILILIILIELFVIWFIKFKIFYIVLLKVSGEWRVKEMSIIIVIFNFFINN